MEEPILIKAGDLRLRLGHSQVPPKVDCRVVAEDVWQELKSQLEDKDRKIDVRYRRELLIALLREQDLEYIQQQDCPELLADAIIKAIYSI